MRTLSAHQLLPIISSSSCWSALQSSKSESDFCSSLISIHEDRSKHSTLEVLMIWRRWRGRGVRWKGWRGRWREWGELGGVTGLMATHHPSVHSHPVFGASSSWLCHTLSFDTHLLCAALLHLHPYNMNPLYHNKYQKLYRDLMW